MAGGWHFFRRPAQGDEAARFRAVRYSGEGGGSRPDLGRLFRDRGTQNTRILGPDGYAMQSSRYTNAFNSWQIANKNYVANPGAFPNPGAWQTNYLAPEKRLINPYTNAPFGQDNPNFGGLASPKPLGSFSGIETRRDTYFGPGSSSPTVNGARIGATSAPFVNGQRVGSFSGLYNGYGTGANSALTEGYYFRQPIRNFFSGTATGRALNSPTLGGLTGGGLYAASLATRMGSDQSIYPNVVAPAMLATIGAGLGQSGFNMAARGLAREGALGFSIGEAAAGARTGPTLFRGNPLKVDVANVGASSLRFGMAATAGLDFLRGVGAASSFNPATSYGARAELGGMSLSLPAAALASMAVGAAGVANPFGLAGLAASAAVGVPAYMAGSYLQSRYGYSAGETERSGIFGEMKAITGAYSNPLGVQGGGIRSGVPEKLTGLQQIGAIGANIIDMGMAAFGPIYDLPSRLAKTPTIQAARESYTRMESDSMSGSGQFKGLTPGQGRAALIASAFQASPINVGRNETLADVLDNGGLLGFVRNSLNMYSEMKSAGFSDAQIAREQLIANQNTYKFANDQLYAQKKLYESQGRHYDDPILRKPFKDAVPALNAPWPQQVAATKQRVMAGPQPFNPIAGLKQFGQITANAITSAVNFFSKPVTNYTRGAEMNATEHRIRQLQSVKDLTGTHVRNSGVNPRNSNQRRGWVDYSGQRNAYYAKVERERSQREANYALAGQGRLAAAMVPHEIVSGPDYDFRDLTGGVSDVRFGLNNYMSQLDSSYAETKTSLSTQFTEATAIRNKELAGVQAAYKPVLSRLSANAKRGEAGASEALQSETLSMVNSVKAINSQLKLFQVQLTESNKKLDRDYADNKNKALESTILQAEFAGESMMRGNYQIRQQAFRNKRNVLNTKRQTGQISNVGFMAQDFDLSRTEFQADIQYLQESMAPDQRSLQEAEAALAYYESNGQTPPPGTRERIATLRGQIATRQGLISEHQSFLNSNFADTNRRAMIQRGVSSSVEKFASPFTNQFFNTIARGGTFGDAFKSLGGPALQLVGKGLTRGFSNAVGRFVASGAAGRGGPIAAGALSLLGIGKTALAAAGATGASAAGGAVASSASTGIMQATSSWLASQGVGNIGSQLAAGAGNTAVNGASTAVASGTANATASAGSSSFQAALGGAASLSGMAGGILGTVGGSLLGKAVMGERFSTMGSTIGGAVGAFAGAAIGTAILPGIGTFIGGMIGGFVGSFGGGAAGGMFGGSSKKAQAKWMKRQEYYKSELFPWVDKMVNEADVFDYDGLISRTKSLRNKRLTNGGGSEGQQYIMDAYYKLHKIKDAVEPYKDLTRQAGSIPGGLLKNSLDNIARLNLYGPYQDAPAKDLYGFYRGIQNEISQIKPEARAEFKSLSQTALKSEYDYNYEKIGVQIGRAQTEYGFLERSNALKATERSIDMDVYTRSVSTFDRDTQRQMERVMGTLQRRGNRQSIAKELQEDRNFERGILNRKYDLFQQASGLDTDQDAYRLTTANQDLQYMLKSQQNLTAEYERLYPLIGDINDELLRMLSAIKDINDALRRL